MITSNAKWEKIEDTHDAHHDVEFAKNICKILLSDFCKHNPCPTRGICLDAWVEIDGVKQDD